MKADDIVFTGSMKARDYIAIQAMQGLLSSAAEDAVGNFAEYAYKMADAMIEESNK